MESVFDELKVLIDYIQVLYTKVTAEWMSRAVEKVNLKKAQVVDIEANGIIYSNITEYVQLLNEQFSEISLLPSGLCHCHISNRIKAQNSIESKIQSYKGERHEFGHIPVNKCINDLFGIRVILKEPSTLEKP